MIRKGLRIVTATALSIGGVLLAGCETPEQTQALIGLATMGQVSPNTTPAQKAVWAGVGAGAQAQHQEQVAREGRTQVNLNVAPSQLPGYAYPGGPVYNAAPAFIPQGTRHPQYPNVLANGWGGWMPAPGYKWLTDAPGDYRVVRVP